MKLWKTSPNNNLEFTWWGWLGRGFLGPQPSIYWACHHLFPVNYPLQCKVTAESSGSQRDLQQVSLLENSIFHRALEIQQHGVINGHSMIIIFYYRIKLPKMEATHRNHQNAGLAQGSGTDLFSLGTSGRSWGNDMKQCQGRFRLEMTKSLSSRGWMSTETGPPEKWVHMCTHDVYKPEGLGVPRRGIS